MTSLVCSVIANMLQDNVEACQEPINKRARSSSCFALNPDQLKTRSDADSLTLVAPFPMRRGGERKKRKLPSISIIQVHPRRRHIFTSAPGIKFHPRGDLFALQNKGRRRDGLSRDGTLENEGVALEAKVTRTLSSSSWRSGRYQARKGRGVSSEEGWR